MSKESTDALFDAAMKGDVAIVKDLINNKGLAVDTRRYGSVHVSTVGSAERTVSLKCSVEL